MKKLFVLIAFLLAMSILPTPAEASEKIAGRSASLTSTLERQERDLSSDMRVIALQNVFKKYNSVLVDSARDFVFYADKYGIDWRLLPSIAGNESYYATWYVGGSYNAYGWGGGYIYFEDWSDGINTISQNLQKNYYNRGATTLDTIGPIYAEDPLWSQKVGRYYDEIEAEYKKLTTLTVAPQF